jgi:hypothetical protein
MRADVRLLVEEADDDMGIELALRELRENFTFAQAVQ